MTNNKCKMSKIRRLSGGINVEDPPSFWRNKCSGFTLIEVLVVLALLGMITFIVAGVSSVNRDEECFEETRTRMEEIKKAILGHPSAHIQGDRRFFGYVTDMGELPELQGEYSQPVGLWNGDNLPEWGYTGEISRIWMGWHGPYIECPTGTLTDGWGSPLRFERFDIEEGKEKIDPDGANMKIKSYGANGTEDEEGTGYDEDIEIKIYYNQYMGVVAGYAGRDVTGIMIYYPENGEEKIVSVTLSPGDHFRFEKGGSGNSDIPFGIRSIKVTGGSGKTYIFTVEPTINWMGTLE